MRTPVKEETFSDDPRTSHAKSRITELSAASRPLTNQKYRPAAPGKAARRLDLLRQTLCLPKTLLAIVRMIREDFTPGALDENLWAFWGFHQEVSGHELHAPNDPYYRARKWEKVRLSSIRPQNVVGGLAVWEIAFMMNVAMENEDPIMEYSGHNGEGFRYLLPNLGRFMGKNEEQARYAAEHGLPWCESAWCAEERRHSNAFARMIERLVNISPNRENPNQPMAVTPDEAAAVRLLLNRQVVEWNASSSYAVMAAHSSGDLRVLLRNILRDEIKHLSILSSADSYLFGPRPWGRFVDWVKMGLEFYRGQRKDRSGGEILGGNPVLALEGIVAHLLTAFFLSRWLRTVPLRTLTAVFETPSRLEDLAAFVPTPERQEQIDATLREGKDRRMALIRWNKGQGGKAERSKALARRQFEEPHREIIERIVAAELDGFQGAESPGSPRDKTLRRWIDSLALESHGLERHGKNMLRRCLRDRLRHYQIQNNRYVLSRDFIPIQALERKEVRIQQDLPAISGTL
jgi:hypothetical protein